MDNFQKIKASKLSLSMRKLVCGRGINDAWFKVNHTINGKRALYKVYSTWMHMITRCYSVSYQNKFQTYRGCTVCEELHLFSAFEAWMLTQDFDGMALDKDIIKQGNKIYSPIFCRFVSPALNNLLIGCDAARGAYPRGVSLDKQRKKYKASISINGKSKHLGYFNTAQEAKDVYDNAKSAEIHRHALMQDDPEVKAGLMNWVVE